MDSFAEQLITLWRIAIPTVEQKGNLKTECNRRDGDSATVLVAEDDPFFRKLLQSRLQSWGYQVAIAENGTQAWELLEQSNTPDLIILDWLMPGIDGIELCRRIRARQRERDRYQYILLVSGKDEKRDVVAGLEAGADDYVTKPFDMGELEARLRTGKRILSLQHELIQAREILRYQATHDDLTGLLSRAATLHLLERELQRGRRSRTPTGLLMIDIDRFKSVNDTYGHLNGDTVLKEVAYRISHTMRSYDFVGRYGGEEFVAVLSKCSPDDLRNIAERALSAVSESPVKTEGGDLIVTVSIGGAVTPNNISDLELLSVADSSLYEAKRTGRNRVVTRSCEASSALDTRALGIGTQPLTPGT